MRKHILYWLFGTDDIEKYMELLFESINHTQKEAELIADHMKTLNEEKENLQIIRKLIRICENHGIDANEEIKHVEL